jgi:hypothetical protein
MWELTSHITREPLLTSVVLVVFHDECAGLTSAAAPDINVSVVALVGSKFPHSLFNINYHCSTVICLCIKKL